ncbi:MAG: recombinase family protein, partial [Patescibacteria group bacterium]
MTKRRGQKVVSTLSPLEGRKGLVYARVSTQRQVDEGTGLESQENRCIKDLCASGMPYVHSFLDSYTGEGDFMARPAMRELLAYIDARPGERFLVIFDDLKRFARDTEFHIKLRTAFKIRDVQLKCLNFNFEDSPEGRFVETVFAGQAQLEREQNKRQVMQKMKARLEAGYWTFGTKKGYDMVTHSAHGKLAVPNEEGLTMLKPAMEMFAMGTLVRKIDVCRFLVEKGFWKNQSPEKYIDKLVYMMRDPFYCGDLHYPSWNVSRRKGQHEGVVSLEVFENVQVRLRKDNAGARIRTDITPEFPLRGLLVCTECKRHLTAAWSKGSSKKYPYYYCQNKACGLYSKMFRKEDTEIDFKALLERNTLKPEVDKIVSVVFDRVWEQEVSNMHSQERSAEQKVKTLRNEIRELSDLVIKAKSETLQRAYEAQIEERAKELECLEQTLGGERDLKIPYRTALGKATGMLKSPISIWDTVDTVEKHRLFFFLFEKKLEYAKEGGYRTADLLSNTRLFEEFATANPLDVEAGGIEPPSESVYESA